jgi:hypothetical protein
MTAPVGPSERDVCALAGMVSQQRDDLPDQGLPMSLLSELKEQIPCDVISFEGFDSQRKLTWFGQFIPGRTGPAQDPFEPAHWQHYWDCQPCSYPDRTGDLRRVVRIDDFYSAGQWHSTGMYCDLYRPKGYEHELGCRCPTARPGRRGRGARCGCSCSAGRGRTSRTRTGRR